MFIRDPGAKRPIDQHDHLVELARRGEEAGQRARERLSEGLEAIGLLFADEPDSGPRPSILLVARAAPLTVTPTVRDWPLTRAAADWCAERAEFLAPRALAFFQRGGPWREPFGRGIAARVIQQTGSDSTDSALVVADSAGVIGARIRWGAEQGDEPSITLDQLDLAFGQLERTLADGLRAAEAYGRSVAEVYLSLPERGRVYGGQSSRGPSRLHASRELTVPADADEVASLAGSWDREFQRALGVERYEGEPE